MHYEENNTSEEKERLQKEAILSRKYARLGYYYLYQPSYEQLHVTSSGGAMGVKATASGCRVCARSSALQGTWCSVGRAWRSVALPSSEQTKGSAAVGGPAIGRR